MFNRSQQNFATPLLAKPLRLVQCAAVAFSLAGALGLPNAANAQPELAQPAVELLQLVSEYQSLKNSLNANTLAGWPDQSLSAINARKKVISSIRERLSALSTDGLGEQDLLTLQILSWQVGLDEEEFAFGTERMPFIAGDGFFTTPTYVAGVTTIRSPEQGQAWLNKLSQLPDFYDQAVANMRRGVSEGFVQTRPTTEAALNMLELAYATPSSEDALLMMFTTRPPSIDEAQWQDMRDRAQAIIETSIRPAQKRVIDFLKADYLPNARPHLGASSLPDGRAYYAYLVRRNTGSEMTPDDVFAIGQSEVARIRTEMEAAIRETGFEGSFSEFLAYLKTDPKFYPDSVEDALEKGAEIAKRADYLLPQYFKTLPRLTYGVLIKPKELEGSSGAYYLGSPENGVAGGVMMGRDADKGPLYNLPAWILHEGVPGHHLQIALGQERFDLPEFRRSDEITVFVEGWALYAEKLGVEMGIYRDPYEDFGRLSFEIWRACRLVMDVGIHWKGWSYDQAAECLRENTALTDGSIEYETYRYIGWPGQALAYKIGELEIIKLRKHAEAALGPKFDLRGFHTMVIDSGPMPMSVLADRTDRWIAAQKLDPARDLAE